MKELEEILIKSGTGEITLETAIQQVSDLFTVSGLLPSENEINNKAVEFANKRYYKESSPHDTTINDFKAGVQWLLGYMAGNDR